MITSFKFGDKQHSTKFTKAKRNQIQILLKNVIKEHLKFWITMFWSKSYLFLLRIKNKKFFWRLLYWN